MLDYIRHYPFSHRIGKPDERYVIREESHYLVGCAYRVIFLEDSPEVEYLGYYKNYKAAYRVLEQFKLRGNTLDTLQVNVINYADEHVFCCGVWVKDTWCFFSFNDTRTELIYGNTTVTHWIDTDFITSVPECSSMDTHFRKAFQLINKECR